MRKWISIILVVVVMSISSCSGENYRSKIINEVNGDLPEQIEAQESEYIEYMGKECAKKYQVKLLNGGFEEIETVDVYGLKVYNYVLHEQVVGQKPRSSYLSIYSDGSDELIGVSYKGIYTSPDSMIFPCVMRSLLKLDIFNFPKDIKYNKEMYNKKQEFKEYSVANLFKYFEDGENFFVIAKNDYIDTLMHLKK